MIQVNYSAGHEETGTGFVSGPNSAGGVSVSFAIKNLSEKSIKYYVLYFVPINAVGDKVSCSITGKVENGVRGTGPIAQNQGQYSRLFENAWYNHSIKSVKLTKAEIQYMDGTTETIDGSQIGRISGGGNGGCCYVATAVYGSYDCPEVWTLRRYRDNTLAETWYGRAFKKTYYTISPFIVRHFGDTKWFKKMWRGTLDRKVKKLQNKGYESTPYEDKEW